VTSETKSYLLTVLITRNIFLIYGNKLKYIPIYNIKRRNEMNTKMGKKAATLMLPVLLLTSSANAVRPGIGAGLSRMPEDQKIQLIAVVSGIHAVIIGYYILKTYIITDLANNETVVPDDENGEDASL